MMRTLVLFLALALPQASQAQIVPVPGFDDPRLQTVSPVSGQPIRLVTFPDAPLTLLLVPGEKVERVALSDSEAYEVSVAGAGDSLSIRPRRPAAAADLTVETASQNYRLQLETGRGLAAAYVVRMVGVPVNQPLQPMPAGSVPPRPPLAAPTLPEQMTGTYRVSGNRELRPTSIGDDGSRTYIQWGEYQAMPAVFGIGPTGDEEVVDGHMRGGLFTIDRVYRELVFRIDEAKAQARRSEALANQ
jgi:type IV secretion system protein VirB9